MTWHKFIEGKSYNRDDIVAACEKRIKSGKVKNKLLARECLKDIRTRPFETLVWHPFGTTSHGRCPWHWRAWQTPNGEPICNDHVVPWKG